MWLPVVLERPKYDNFWTHSLFLSQLQDKIPSNTKIKKIKRFAFETMWNVQLIAPWRNRKWTMDYYCICATFSDLPVPGRSRCDFQWNNRGLGSRYTSRPKWRTDYAFYFCIKFLSFMYRVGIGRRFLQWACGAFGCFQLLILRLNVFSSRGRFMQVYGAQLYKN